MFFQTEYEFDLPCGYVDEDGNLHRHGIMRLATAMDEIEARKDQRCRVNPDYIPVLLLSRVIVKLDGTDCVTPEWVEKLFTADFSFLQNMYETVNNAENPVIHVQCPHCGKSFEDTINFRTGE